MISGVGLPAGPNDLLENCFARVQLSNGASFSLEGMACTTTERAEGWCIEAGGTATLPRLRWDVRNGEGKGCEISLTVTNTTAMALPVERLDVIVSRSGYRRIPTRELQLRRTGWQSFSIATVRSPFDDPDPWLQPPLHVPQLPPSPAEEQVLPWMTVLRADGVAPLLVGFVSSEDYLGMVHVGSSSDGHYLAAACYAEGTELAPEASLTSEPVVILGGQPEAALLEAYADRVAGAMSARVPSDVTTGWSTWFAYFTETTAGNIADNLTAIRDSGLPLSLIGVDDSYQTKFGDWLSVDPVKFPEGMAAVAARIHRDGLRAGLWLTPFMANASSDVVRRHPDWFLHDERGRLIDVNRHGDVYWTEPNYGLDLTHPEACAWLETVVSTVIEKWGFDSLKIDYLYAGALRARRYDPNVTSVQAYRRGLRLIRRIAGERYLLGCGAPLLSSVGLVDAMRISSDLVWSDRPADPTLPRRDPLAALMSHLWMNRKLWLNDPDYLHMRQRHGQISRPQVEALTALIALSGGALQDSDDFTALGPDQLGLLRRVYPAAPVSARPVGEIPGRRPDRLVATAPGGYLVARFNWANRPQTTVFEPADFELPPGRYHLYDTLRGVYLGCGQSFMLGDTPPYGATLLYVCPAQDHPQVIGTTHHLLGPAGDIGSVRWAAGQLEITRRTGSPASVRLHVPAPYRLEQTHGCQVVGEAGTTLIIRPSESPCRLDFERTGE